MNLSASVFASAENAIMDSSGTHLIVIIGIIAAAVTAIIILIAAMYPTKEKKEGFMYGVGPVSHPNYHPTAYPQERDGAAPAGPVIPPFAGEVNPWDPNQGAAETSVLDQGAEETTSLADKRSMASIIRRKNGESVAINKERFCIGRERSRVDFCIGDNSAVGRLHAIILTRDGKSYIVDQNSRNFTFVNDVRSYANTETELKDGARISLGDEEFIFKMN